MRAILTYHSIDGSGSPISLDERAFRAHIDFLSSGAVPVVPLADLPGVPAESDAVSLTFDDAFASFATIAAPLLGEHRLPATLFVVTDHVGGVNDWGGRQASGIPTLPLMTWDQVAAAAESGVEVGAHTRTHPVLTSVADERVAHEMHGARERIKAETGTVPTSFAYPYGAVDNRVAALARGIFARSCTTALRALRAGEDSALLPRLDAWYFRLAGQLESWGTPAFRGRLWVRSQGRRVKQLLTAVT